MIDPNQAPRGEDAAAIESQPDATRRERIGRVERFALFITNVVGTIGFFFVILGWTVLWLVWNALGPKSARFDPYPAFVLWLFISNMIQLFLMPLIMVGQNIQARAADKRAEADLAINRSAEEGVKQIRDGINELRTMLEQLKASNAQPSRDEATALAI